MHYFSAMLHYLQIIEFIDPRWTTFQLMVIQTCWRKLKKLHISFVLKSTIFYYIFRIQKLSKKYLTFCFLNKNSLLIPRMGIYRPHFCSRPHYWILMLYEISPVAFIRQCKCIMVKFKSPGDHKMAACRSKQRILLNRILICSSETFIQLSSIQ